jgi:hypothetical protein
MDIEQFRDDDRGYLTWTAAHATGYVINVQRSLNPSDARLHRADCYTINGRPAGATPGPGRTSRSAPDQPGPCRTGHTPISEQKSCAVAHVGHPCKPEQRHSGSCDRPGKAPSNLSGTTTDMVNCRL